MAKKKTVVEQPTTTEVIDTTSTPVNTEAIKEAINNVDTTIKNDFEETVSKIEEQIQDEVKPLQEMKEQVKELTDSEKLDEVMSNTPEKAEEYIKNEIKKATELKDAVQKIINNTKSKNLNMTNWWNGMGYDF
jgi:hypothetical protein